MTEEQIALELVKQGVLVRWRTILAALVAILLGLGSFVWWGVGWVSQRHEEIVTEMRALEVGLKVVQVEIRDIHDRLNIERLRAQR